MTVHYYVSSVVSSIDLVLNFTYTYIPSEILWSFYRTGVKIMAIALTDDGLCSIKHYWGIPFYLNKLLLHGLYMRKGIICLLTQLIYLDFLSMTLIVLFVSWNTHACGKLFDNPEETFESWIDFIKKGLIINKIINWILSQGEL